MESLLCSFLCFGLYSYDLWTMGNLARGPVKDLVTALLGLLLLPASARLGIPAGGWVLVTLLLLSFTFFYAQELFPLQWKQTILPGLVLTILTALGQAATGLRPHGLFPLRLSTLPFPWTVSLTLALCLTLLLSLVCFKPWKDLRSLEHERSFLQAHLEKSREQMEQAKNEFIWISQDPHYFEMIARDKGNLALPGEHILRITEPKRLK